MKEENNDILNGSITLDEWLEKQPLTSLQWLVFLTTSFAMMANGLGLQVLSLAVPLISRDWSIPPEQLSWTFSLCMIGMGVGAAFIGPLGDRFGRKPVLIIGLFALAGGCLLSAIAVDVQQMGIGRFVTGLGIGAVNVNALALTTDYAPPRRRFLIMTLMICSVAVGATIVSLIAPNLISAFGWRGFFIAVSLPAIVVALWSIFFLPESISFILRSSRPERARLLTDKIEAGVSPAHFTSTNSDEQRPSVRALFTPELIVRTLAIWCVYALGTFTSYVIMTWLPTLLSLAGWTDAEALRGSSSIQLGAIVGGITVAITIDKGHLIGALVAGYAVAIAALLLVLALPANVLLWSSLLFLVGVGVSGNQLVLSGVSSALYPPHLRATSNGWASAFARIGGILAPIAGGVALARGIEPAWIIGLLAIPMILQIVILWLSRRWFVH